MSTTSTFVRMQSDGTLVRVHPDGTEEKLVVQPPEPRSDEAITEAALRDWEQGRCEPDQLARAYLTVIAYDPEGVWKALQAGPH